MIRIEDKALEKGKEKTHKANKAEKIPGKCVWKYLKVQ